MHVSLLNQRYSLALLLIVLIGRFGCSELDMDGEITLRLEHSLDMGKSWKDRGSLSFSKARSAIPTVNQGPFSDENLTILENLCSKNMFYLIKVSGEGIGELQSYTPACTMLDSSLAEQITIFLDWRGNPVAANLASRIGVVGHKVTAGKFDTRIQIQSMENGPTPDTAAYIQKMEEEKSRKMSGEKQDNKSFFAKYWMYIVPLCFILLINSAGAPENGGGR